MGMKILMVNKFLFPNGGSETYIFNLGDFLKSQGHEVEYFGMDHPKRMVSNSADAYVSSVDFHARTFKKLIYPMRIIYSLEARKKLRKVLEAFKPQVVHLNNFNFQLTPSILYELRAYKRKSMQGVSIIYTAHDYQLICPNHLLNIPSAKVNCQRCVNGHFGSCIKYKCIHNSILRSFLGAFEGYLYKRLRTYLIIDRIICPSQFMEDKISKNPDLKGRTVTLRNFIPDRKEPDGVLSPPQKYSAGEITSKRRFDHNGRYVLYFGRFSEEKGIQTLLKACAALPHIPFVLAGTGPLESALKPLNNVKNLGFVTGQALKQLIAHASFSVYPSEWYENCPFSIMESQILGTPVIGADIGGIPELIAHGISGELFPSGDHESLKRAIERLWTDHERLELYTRRCLDQSYTTLPDYCDQLIKLYQGQSS